MDRLMNLTKKSLHGMHEWGENYLAIKNKYVVVVVALLLFGLGFILNQIQANDAADRARADLQQQAVSYQTNHNVWEQCMSRVRNGPLVIAILTGQNETNRQAFHVFAGAQGISDEELEGVDAVYDFANEKIADDYPIMSPEDCGSEPLPPEGVVILPAATVVVNDSTP